MYTAYVADTPNGKKIVIALEEIGETPRSEMLVFPGEPLLLM